MEREREHAGLLDLGGERRVRVPRDPAVWLRRELLILIQQRHSPVLQELDRLGASVVNQSPSASPLPHHSPSLHHLSLAASPLPRCSPSPSKPTHVRHATLSRAWSFPSALPASPGLACMHAFGEWFRLE